MQALSFAAGKNVPDNKSSGSTALPVVSELSCGRAGIGPAGPLLKSAQTATACACLSLCRATAQCQAWQWVDSSDPDAADNTTCYLKPAGFSMVPNSNSISGCRGEAGGACPPPPPPPLNRTLLGWAFVDQIYRSETAKQQRQRTPPLGPGASRAVRISSAVILHLGGNAIDLDLSEMLAAHDGVWQITAMYPRAGAAALLRNMSAVECGAVIPVPRDGVVAIPAYSVLRLERTGGVVPESA